jgi:beta-glucosidase
MSAFNAINGVPASANAFTLTKVLRDEWKFDGFVVSDYTSVKELINHGIAANEEEAAAAALNAGVEMEMVSRSYNTFGPKLLQQNKVSRARIDEAVRRILRIKFRLGLFDRPYADEALEPNALLRPESIRLAREVAGRSIVRS